MRSSKKQPETLTLADAAATAAREGVLIRAHRCLGDREAEVYFYGDSVIHAAVGASLGVDAIVELGREGIVDFEVTRGDWPRQQTLLIRWDALLAEAMRRESSRPRILSEHDATVRIPDEG